MLPSSQLWGSCQSRFKAHHHRTRVNLRPHGCYENNTKTAIKGLVVSFTALFIQEADRSQVSTQCSFSMQLIASRAWCKVTSTFWNLATTCNATLEPWETRFTSNEVIMSAWGYHGDPRNHDFLGSLLQCIKITHNSKVARAPAGTHRKQWYETSIGER